MDSTILDATSGNTYRFSTASSTAAMTCERVAPSIERSANCSAELATEAIASIKKTAVLRCPMVGTLPFLGVKCKRLCIALLLGSCPGALELTSSDGTCAKGPRAHWMGVANEAEAFALKDGTAHGCRIGGDEGNSTRPCLRNTALKKQRIDSATTVLLDYCTAAELRELRAAMEIDPPGADNLVGDASAIRNARPVHRIGHLLQDPCEPRKTALPDSLL